MNKKKILWLILLVIGIIPFIIPLIAGIYDSINGFAGICFADCTYDYGFSAFRDVIFIYSWLMWPTYIVGGVLIVISLIKLKKKNNNNK